MQRLFLTYLILLLSFTSLYGTEEMVISTQKIVLENFPDAHNPSLIKFKDGFLLTFRYCPERRNQPWNSEIGVVLLNDALQQISLPELLNTRLKFSKTPSQAEDARIFSYKSRLFLIYNDNIDIIAPPIWERRDMFMAELFYDGSHFSLSPALKLVYEEKYQMQAWQKNWVPFEWKGKLFMIYSINPHEILFPNLMTGSCYHCYDTWAPLEWNFGALRGSTPPLLIEGEYLAFFHSSAVVASPASWDMNLWHYFMGAYTFSATPPFQITKISPKPIVAEGFYTPSGYEKRVVFPGGFVISDSIIYVAYGKDDSEIWIASLDKEALMRSLIPIKK